MNEVPELIAYTSDQLATAASWPAIERYLRLLNREGVRNDGVTISPADDPRAQLRLKRHELWLRCALATYFGHVPAATVCAFWSIAAESLIHEAWLLSGAESAGLGLLALGKLGATELNLSSDVDLIVVRADDTSPDLKVFREFQALLSDTSEFGFCLRTDFALRPGGRAAAAIPSVTEFEYHYGYHGEMWERLAYVRMRMLEGPPALRANLETFARKFSFRKHLDYTLIDELKSLRSKIRAEKFEARPDHFHLKLGEGGIRELELFVHALQVLHGGRNPSLQTHSTTQALAIIKNLGLLPADECDFLLQAYWTLRTLENRLQAYDDQQAYSVDLRRGHPALPTGFADDLAPLTKQVITIATSLFGPDRAQSRMPETPEARTQWLRERGFSAKSAEETWSALWAATALSRRSEQDEDARHTFLQGFVVKLSELNLDRDLGLSLLLDFVRAIRAKASFFTLLNRESRVRDELAMLFSISPYLGSLLASRPELIDEFIYRKQAPPSADFGTLLDDLAERRLLSELIAATQFLSDRDLRKMTINLTSNADAIATTLLERMKTDLSTGDIGLIALGKWGGRELGLRSDLDFIFVTPAAPTAEGQKLAKRFLSRMTEPHRGGSIYAIDMRLRPSGNAGPIMVPKAELEIYLSEKAAAWERQAYLRARPLCDLGFHPGAIAASRGLDQSDRNELRMIRAKLFKTPARGADEIDLKLCFGGLADVEFTAQIALLARGEFSLDPSTSGMIQYLESIDEKIGTGRGGKWLARWTAVGPRVREDYEWLRGIEQLHQLTTSQSGSKMRVKSDEFKRLARLLGCSTVDLEARIHAVFETVTGALREVSDLES